MTYTAKEFVNKIEEGNEENLYKLFTFMSENNNKNAFLYLFNSLAEEQKHKLLKTTGFSYTLLQIAKKLPMKEFNEIFFSYLKDYANNKWMKYDLYQIKENKKLDDFLFSEDMPKNKSDLLDKIKFYYREDKEKYYQTIEREKIRLKNINKIDPAKKSIILENLFAWFSEIARKKGFSEVITVAKEIGYEFKISDSYMYNQRINLPYDAPLNKKDIKVLKSFTNNYVGIPKYKVLNSTTNIMSSSIDMVIRKLKEEDKELGLFLWDALEEELILKRQGSHDVFEEISKAYQTKNPQYSFSKNVYSIKYEETVTDLREALANAKVKDLQSKLPQKEINNKRMKL